MGVLAKPVLKEMDMAGLPQVRGGMLQRLLSGPLPQEELIAEQLGSRKEMVSVYSIC